jgi:uncharacterized membrane-anchored protein YhcB (DUF1043 family)
LSSDINYPIITISLIVGIIVGIASIFFKLREIGDQHRKEIEETISQKYKLEIIANELRSKLEQANEKIKRLESRVFKND